MPKRVSGHNALYHYLQKVVIPREDDFAKELITRLIVDLSIWLPPELFVAVPVLLPYCVRDPKIKRQEWGSADSQGNLRDNNNLVKNIVSNYPIQSAVMASYHNGIRGRGFVASHAWRWIRVEGQRILSARYNRTYSFIPNLSWLPEQVSKLTDHQGSYAQKVLQSLAYKLYRPHAQGHSTILQSIWDVLPDPGLDLDVDLAQLNLYKVSPRAITMRRNRVLADIEAIEQTVANEYVSGDWKRSARYLPSLVRGDSRGYEDLLHWLGAYKTYLASRDT